MFGDIVGGVLGGVIFLAVPAYFVLQPWASIRLNGGWRVASACAAGVCDPCSRVEPLRSEPRLQSVAAGLHFLHALGTLYLVIILLISRFKS